MKKIISLLVLFVFSMFLFSCQSDNNDNTTTTSSNGGNQSTTTTNSSNEQTTTTEEEVHYDLGGQDFIIISNNPATADPRSDKFEGLYQTEKQQLITQVEEKYNIKVVFKPYPSQASFGDARDRWIINNVVSGSPAGHIYEISSVSVPTLAKAGAIQPLKAFIEQNGDPSFFESKKQFGRFLDEYYVYDDIVPANTVGIFYNQDLLDDLGYEKNLPSKLWNQGEWTWDKFEDLCKELNTKLNEDNGEYPIGGRTYNWAYEFVYANGGYLVNDQLQVGVTNTEALNAFQQVADLYAQTGMWLSESDLSNTVEQEFKQGKIVFHNGEFWYSFTNNKFGERSFTDLGFVPFPTGDDTNADLSNYKNVIMYGPKSYVISAGYEKDKIPAGYESMFIHNELIFKIWNEMMYFGEEEDYYYDFATELFKYYADDESVTAHESVLDMNTVDYFYSFGADATGQVEGSMMLMIESAMKNNNVRATMESMKPVLDELIRQKFSDD